MLYHAYAFDSENCHSYKHRLYIHEICRILL